MDKPGQRPSERNASVGSHAFQGDEFQQKLEAARARRAKVLAQKAEAEKFEDEEEAGAPLIPVAAPTAVTPPPAQGPAKGGAASSGAHKAKAISVAALAPNALPAVAPALLSEKPVVAAPPPASRKGSLKLVAGLACLAVAGVFLWLSRPDRIALPDYTAIAAALNFDGPAASGAQADLAAYLAFKEAEAAAVVTEALAEAPDAPQDPFSLDALSAVVPTVATFLDPDVADQTTRPQSQTRGSVFLAARPKGSGLPQAVATEGRVRIAPGPDQVGPAVVPPAVPVLTAPALAQPVQVNSRRWARLSALSDSRTPLSLSITTSRSRPIVDLSSPGPVPTRVSVPVPAQRPAITDPKPTPVSPRVVLRPDQSGGSAERPLYVHLPSREDPDDFAELLASVNARVTPHSELRPVSFKISEAQIRVYHEEDLATAAEIAKALDVALHPLTELSPRPRLGLIELWLPGASNEPRRVASPAPRRQASPRPASVRPAPQPATAEVTATVRPVQNGQPVEAPSEGARVSRVLVAPEARRSPLRRFFEGLGNTEQRAPQQILQSE